MFSNTYLLKSLSLCILLILLAELITPVMVVASISSQPDTVGGASSYKDMVDPFTGQFHYSIPLMNVPGAHGAGYGINLNYTAGSGPEAEASWVGYGWSLNTGSITRNKRGFADDMFDENVTYYNKIRPIETWAAGATGSASVEVFDVKGLGLGANEYFRYNTEKGFSISGGFWGSALGIANIGLNVDTQEGTSASYSANLSIQNLLNLIGMIKGGDEGRMLQVASQDYIGYPSLVSVSGRIGGTEPPRPTNMKTYKSNGFSASLSTQGIVYYNSGSDVGLFGMTQKIEGIESINKSNYGYMYSVPVIKRATTAYNIGKDDKALMDYSTEREAPFDVKRTTRLHVPFANSDNFIVGAQGLSGTFRVHNKGTVQYRPSFQENTTKFKNLSFQPMIPSPSQTYALSGSADPATTNIRIEKSSYFEPNGNEYGSTTTGWFSSRTKPYFFRFQNDIGGNVLQSRTDDPVLLPRSNTEGNYYHEVNRGRTPGSTNFIGFNTYQDLQSSAGSQRKYSHGTNVTDIFGTNSELTEEKFRQKNLLLHQVAEYSVVNSTGNRYTFGLPVYARNEVSMSYDASPSSANVSTTIISKAGASPKSLSMNAVAIGEEHKDPYIASHLLTEITTPDYIDRTNNGPTSDDFGGWVKFNYTRVHGSNNKYSESPWFKWRSPYYGLRYSINTYSKEKDDVGSVSYGEREVYVLTSIQTATHIAKFTVDGSGRLDGSGAGEEAAAAEYNPSGSTPAAVTGVKSNMLRHIDLYVYQPDGTIGSNPVPLQSVYFAYDYSTWPKTWDNVNTFNGSGNTSGKLTLRKVWFESMGVKNASIAPYEFYYTYQDRGSAFTSYYGSGSNSPSSSPFNSSSSLLQTPDYNPKNVDRWGCYRDVINGMSPGKEFAVQSHPWVVQNPVSSFDPAAWQLKMIKLPSGGEIHIDYEQNDYQFVQDRRAMKMMKIQNQVLGTSNQVNIADAELFGNVTVSAQMRINMVELLNEQFITKKERAYFKILYDLVGSNCDTREYIRGYARICDIQATSEGIRIKFGNSSGEAKYLPSKAALDYRKAMNINLLSHPECVGSMNFAPPDFDHPEAGFSTLVSYLTTGIGFLANLGPMNPSLMTEPNVITNPSTDKDSYETASYIRLPLLVPKKGGGIRVHRIISISPENVLEVNKAKVNGVEYLYETLDENNRFISSGVATNEPQNGGDENALVRITEENQPEFDEYDLIAGENIEQYEGPLGMQLLPTPSIGYSQIITRNIFHKANTTGFQVTNFYTARDFPTVRMEKTGLDVPERSDRSPVQSDYFVGESNENISLRQGYTFHLTSMHGAARAVFSYGGEYEQGTMGLVRTGGTSTVPPPQFSGSFSASTKYEYFLNNAKNGVADEVPVMYDIDRPLRMEPMGKEMETFFETRGINEVLRNEPTHASLGINLDPPPPYPIPFKPLISYANYTLYRKDKVDIAVTNKIITQPALLKSVETRTADGIVHLSENIAFDPTTGNPAIVRTSDSYHDNGNSLSTTSTGHRGYYTAYSIPACNTNSAMGQKATSEGFVFRPFRTFANIRSSSGSNTLIFDRMPGAYIGAMAAANNENYAGAIEEIPKLFTVDDIVVLRQEPTGTYLGTARITAITPTAPGATYTCTLSPIDGTIGIQPQVSAEIIRSGKTNQLNAVVENVTVYGDSQMDQAISYAKKLFEYKKQAEELNDWLQVQAYDNAPTQNKQLVNTKITYNPFADYREGCTSSATSIRNNSLANEFDPIDYFWSYCKGTSAANYPCSPSLGPYYGLSYRHFELKTTRSSPITSMRLGFTTQGVPAVDRWQNQLTAPNPPTITIPYPAGGGGYDVNEVYQDFPFSGLGQELFHVNDLGELVYYHFLNGTTSNRNVAFAFRENLQASNRLNYINNYADARCNDCSLNPNPARNWHVECPNVVKALPDNIRSSVVAASAQVYDNASPYSNPHPWHPVMKFAYDAEAGTGAVAGRLTNILNGGTPTPTVQTTGTAPGIYDRFDFTGPTRADWMSTNPNWKKVSEIVSFSESGEPIESVDELGVPSTVLYTPVDIALNVRALPSMSAWNAKSDEVFFESYENHHAYSFPFVPGLAHTGNWYQPIATNATYSLNSEFTFPDREKQYIVQFWYAYQDSDVDVKTPTVLLGGTTLTNTSTVRSGRWRLFSAETPGGTFSPSGSSISIQNPNSTESVELYIDDIKIHPYEAKATCTVFDRNLRPVAALDDNHFAMITQYDGQGVPVRTIRETERGFFTVADQHGNVPLIPRSSTLSGLISSSPQPSGGTPLPMMLRTPSPDIGPKTGTRPKDSEWNGKFNALELQLSPDKQNLKVFGIDSVDKLFDAKKIKEKYKLPQGIPSPIDSATIKNSIKDMVPDKSLLKEHAILKKAADSLEKVRTKIQPK